VFNSVQDAFRRQYNNEEHHCGICDKNYLGDKFFFLSGCEHQFCTECICEMVKVKISGNDILSICCAEQNCGVQLTNLDIGNLALGKEVYDKWENLSFRNAIDEMDDMGWCPIPNCATLAHIYKDKNYGQCQHCEFVFCLDCKQKNHPFKRCWINRLDTEDMLDEAELEGVEIRNQRAQEILNNLYFKHCCKQCPKCGLRIQKVRGGCEKGQFGNKMQCPKCFTYFCWGCLHQAKGLKHYKERPECVPEEPFDQVERLTQELKEQQMHPASEDFLNLKFCARCPRCEAINQKQGTRNALTCTKCQRLFCFICNNEMEDEGHYNKVAALCHLNSDPWTDV